MKRARTALLGVLAIAAVALPGCDWLKGSGSGSRVSPFLSSLSFSRPTVLCDQVFQLSFDYDDPQRDVSLLLVSFQHATSATRRDRSVLWEDGGDLDLQTSGRAAYSFSFSCSDPGGAWNVEVQVEDIKGHLSNSLHGSVTLNSAVR